MDIEGLAMWGDDVIAASWREGGVLVRGWEQLGVSLAPVGFAGDSGGLAFSPDGSRLFGRVQSFRAGEVWHDGSRGDAEISSWLTQSRYLDRDHVATTGAHGLAIVTLDPAGTLVLDEDAGEGLAVSGDGSFLCGGYRDGSVVCFERSP